MAVQTKVPLLDLKAQYAQIQNEVEQAVLEVMRSGWYVLGPNVKAFEKEAAEFLEVKETVGCASGSDALYVAMLAFDIGPGDEVITTPFSYIATAECITQAGATPVFADIDLKTYNIDPAKIEEKITDKTKAIIVVHLYGQACDMDAIMAIAKKHNIKVIEDAAQAFGTKYKNQSVGGIGDIGTFSFYPTKNMSCAGDGGLLTTNSPELAEKLRIIRAHGSSKRYYHDMLGVNSRLDEIQAAILRIKLKHIAKWNSRRAEIAAIYNKRFEGVKNIKTPQILEGSSHIYHQYSINVPSPASSRTNVRDLLKAKLAETGIASEVYYPLSMHEQKIYQNLGYKVEDLANSHKATKSVLCLPVFPELTDEQVNYVADNVLSLCK